MNFSDALELIKDGKKLTRENWTWNKQNIFIFLVPSLQIEVKEKPLLDVYPEGTVIRHHPHIDIKYNDGTVIPWCMSQADLLADDWVIVD